MAANDEDRITSMQRLLDRLVKRMDVLQRNVLRERWAAALWHNLPETLNIYREHLFRSDVLEQMDAMHFTDNFSEDGYNRTLQEDITSLYDSLFALVEDRMTWQPWRDHSLDEQHDHELALAESHLPAWAPREDLLDMMEDHESVREARQDEWIAEMHRRLERLRRMWWAFTSAGVNMRVFTDVPGWRLWP